MVILVYALGNPLKIILTAGQVHDITVAPSLIADVKAEIVMADGGYDSDKFRRQKGATACIRPRRNRKVKLEFDKEQYRERHLVECFFQKLKRNRRICTRYEKFASRSLAFIHLACKFKMIYSTAPNKSIAFGF